MIEKIDSILKEPIIYSVPELTLMQNDTLVLEFDQDIWDLNEVNEMMRAITKIYPKNKIMILFKGIKIGVIHNVDN